MPIYMRIEGIDGSATAQGHERWIEILSFSWGASNEAGRAGGGGGAGKVSVQDFHFAKTTDKASPKLFLACCKGNYVPTARIEVTELVGGREEPVQAYELENVLITSYQVSGDGSVVPSDSFSINYTKILYRQFFRLPDGSFDSAVATWDVRRNTGG